MDSRPLVRFHLDEYDTVKGKIAELIRERSPFQVTIPRSEFKNVSSAVALDQPRAIPRGIVGKIRYAIEAMRVSKGLVGNFFAIYLPAKQARMGVSLVEEYGECYAKFYRTAPTASVVEKETPE